MTLALKAIRTLTDNYAWLLADPATGRAAVVDPGQAEPVLEALKTGGFKLEYILLTHLHPDHCGGAVELGQHFPGTRICMHPEDAGRVDFTVDLEVGEDRPLDFNGNAIKVMHLPCHTRGCVAYQVGNFLFTGDTLFAAGCGKFFEGTTAAMRNNLERLKKLAPELLVCCGHEYTLENLACARQADPDNRALAERLAEARKAAAEKRLPLSATLALEQATNPFLRLDDPGLRDNLGTADELETLAALYKIYYRQDPPA